MRFEKIKILYLVIFLASCSTQLTKRGATVRIVTENEKEKYCSFIDIVTTSDEFGWSGAHDRENAMNKARNKVSELNGNAMRIISSDSISSGQYDLEAIVQVEALSCDFIKR